MSTFPQHPKWGSGKAFQTLVSNGPSKTKLTTGCQGILHVKAKNWVIGLSDHSLVSCDLHNLKEHNRKPTWQRTYFVAMVRSTWIVATGEWSSQASTIKYMYYKIETKAEANRQLIVHLRTVAMKDMAQPNSYNHKQYSMRPSSCGRHWESFISFPSFAPDRLPDPSRSDLTQIHHSTDWMGPASSSVSTTHPALFHCISW